MIPLRDINRWRLATRFGCLLLLLAGGTPTTVAAQDDTTRTVILFDRSASMVQPLEGVRKIDLAKQLFQDLSTRFESDPNVAVRFFAGGTSQDEAQDCRASTMALGFGAAPSAAELSALIDDVRAIGRKTPITHALEQAREDFAGWDGPRKIILISDGQETCDGDPEELAGVFFEDGISVDTIGIGPPDMFGQLGSIALSGGGSFQLAANLVSLRGALEGALPTGPATSGGVAAHPALAQGPTASPPAAPTAPGALVAPLPLVAEFALPEAQAPKGGTGVAVEIIFDASGSMAAQLGGKTKLDLALEALRAASQGLESERMQVAFRAYGFDRSVEWTPEASCPNTALLLPFTAAGQAAAVNREAANLSAYGYTPIAQSLALAGKDLQQVEAGQRMIILISDGEETCGGDPEAEARALRELGIDVQVHVVGFDLDDLARTQMQAIAREGDGAYYDASDGAGLGNQLVQVIELAQELADPFDERLIRPVAGGPTIDEAVPLVPGVYTLTEHLTQGDERFFFVDTELAQRGLLRAVIQTRLALLGTEEEAAESDIAYAGFEIRIYGPDKEPINGRWARVYGERGEQAYTGYSDLDGAGFFFSIGNRYSTVNRDSLFVLEVDEAGDIENRQDAAADRDEAELILAGDTRTFGHLGFDDRGDIFRVVPAPDTAALGIDVEFTEAQFRFLLDVRDADTGRGIERFTGLRGTASVTVEIPGGTSNLTLEIRDSNPALDPEFSSYALSLDGQ